MPKTENQMLTKRLTKHPKSPIFASSPTDNLNSNSPAKGNGTEEWEGKYLLWKLKHMIADETLRGGEQTAEQAEVEAGAGNMAKVGVRWQRDERREEWGLERELMGNTATAQTRGEAR